MATAASGSSPASIRPTPPSSIARLRYKASLICEGRHRRALIDLTRFMKRLADKTERPL